MSDLSPETRELLDRARDGEVLSHERNRAIRRRFGAALGLTAAMTVGASTTASGATAILLSIARVVGAASLVGAVGTGAAVGVHAFTRAPRPLPAPAWSAAARLSSAPTPPQRDPSGAAPSIFPPPREEPVPRPSTPVELLAPVVPVAAPTARGGPTTPLATTVHVALAPIPEPPHLAATSQYLGEGHQATPLPSEASLNVPAVASGTAMSTGPDAPIEARTDRSRLVQNAANPPVPEEPLAAEARLIGNAQRALLAGDARAAAALLEEHGRRFPTGALEPERSALRVEVLCASGLWVEAGAAASQFRSRHPGSPLQERWKRSCVGLQKGGIR